MTEYSLLIVSDMTDLRNVREADPQKFNGMDFVFACRDGKKLMGWVPENIYVTIRAEHNMSPEVRKLMLLRKAQGSKICPVN